VQTAGGEAGRGANGAGRRGCGEFVRTAELLRGGCGGAAAEGGTCEKHRRRLGPTDSKRARGRRGAALHSPSPQAHSHTHPNCPLHLSLPSGRVWVAGRFFPIAAILPTVASERGRSSRHPRRDETDGIVHTDQSRGRHVYMVAWRAQGKGFRRNAGGPAVPRHRCAERGTYAAVGCVGCDRVLIAPIWCMPPALSPARARVGA
jgi:hypothetical protein